MGSDMFCLKACDPSKSNDAKYCEHIFDTQGCGFNAPSNARNGVFESCASDSQNFPGAGAPVPPASSECSTFASTAIYGAGATVTVPIPGATTMTFSSTPVRPTPTKSSSSSGASPASASGSRTSSGAAANQTNTASTFTTNLQYVMGVASVLLSVMILA